MADGALDACKTSSNGDFRDISAVFLGRNEDIEDQSDQDNGNSHLSRAEPSTRPKSLRTKVLHCLIEGDELNTLVMSKRLGVHQSSISHVIRDMIAERLIIKNSRGYRLTNMGMVYTCYFDSFNEQLGSLNKHRDFIIDHEISSIPANHLAMIGVVLRARDRMPVNNLMPYRKCEFLYSQLKRSLRIYTLASNLVPEQLTAVLEAGKKGARVKAIMSHETLNSMKRDFIGIFNEASRCKTIEIYINDDVGFSLAVTDENLFLGLHRLDGSYDFDNLIICDDEASLGWGNAVFCCLLKEAKKANEFIR